MKNTLRAEGRPLAESLEAEAESESEKNLIARARAGDSTAFGQLVRRYQELAFRTAFIITANSAEAEDAAQEAVMKAYHALDRFRPDAAFRPWLLQIVANTARNRRRAAGRQAQLALRAAGNTALEAQASPEAAALAEEQRRELLAHVNRLPDGDRLAIACRYFLELSEAETAAAMGCAPGTVKSRLSRALERLRQRLKGSASVEVARG